MPRSSCSVLPLFLALLAGLPALAQKDDLFGSGKFPNFQEEVPDKRFARSKVARLLNEGTDHPGCRQLVGGLLTALAEIGPTLHKRDENFVLDPQLQEAVQTQLSTPAFPALAYLVSMVRRVMIDKALPDAWLQTAKSTYPSAKTIDLAKLQHLADGLALIDSNAFTLPLLRYRYRTDVLSANTAVRTSVMGPFRDAFLDRDVAWGGLTVLDAGLNAPKPKAAKKGARRPEPSPSGIETVAILEWLPPDAARNEVNLLGGARAPNESIRVIAKLAPRQYVDLERVFKGRRVLVKGKFWEVNQTLTEVEVRDALIFEDRDWSGGAGLADPAAVATCPAAVNDLVGLSPQQPGGFRH